MNCREFDLIVNDLASGVLIDAAARTHGLAHAGACARCAARLADERVLNGGLRAFAESTLSEQAPPQLKQSLRAAFAQQHAAPKAAPVLAFTPRRLSVWPRWGLAAAAMLALVALALTFWRATAPPETMLAMPTPTPTPLPGLMPAPTAPPIDQNERVLVKHTPKRSAPRRKTVEAPVQNNVVAQATMADFIPLTYATDARALQNGLIVRVELPRESLLAMGLPLNAERTAATVKADVMMGDDGVAYAIRFVQ